MPRTSPIGIDGVSVQWFTGTDGRAESCRVRVKDQRGMYQAKRFKVTSYRKDGRPCLPVEAKTWAEERRGQFLAGADTAGTCDLPTVAGEYAQQLRDTGANEAYASHIEKITQALAHEGIRDLKAPTFHHQFRGWLTSLKANWWDPEGKAKTRRKESLELSPHTRNKILREIRCVVRYAMRTPPGNPRLKYNPLLGIRRFTTPEEGKALFTISELRQMVSEQSRLSYSEDRRAIREMLLQEGATVESVAAALKVHPSTVRDRLAQEGAEEDPWWLPCCLLVYTGCRAQEAMHLRWEWIDWANDNITLKIRPEFKIKRQRERDIPLQPELRVILEPRKKTSGWIIESDLMRSNGAIERHKRTKEVQKEYTVAFRWYLKRIGIEAGDRGVHSLRHSHISLLLAMNVNFDRVMRRVGHRPAVTTLGYAKQAQKYEKEVKGWPQGELRLRLGVTHP